MYCPRCGKAEQQANTFCRKCGIHLPDFDKIKGQVTSPEQHFSANTTLNILSAVVSLALAITLHVMFTGREDTPVVISVTAGFLTAMFFWQVQILWRTWQLRKQLPGLTKKHDEWEVENIPRFESKETKELLNEPDLRDVVPQTFAEKATDRLSEVPRRESN